MRSSKQDETKSTNIFNCDGEASETVGAVCVVYAHIRNWALEQVYQEYTAGFRQIRNTTYYFKLPPE